MLSLLIVSVQVPQGQYTHALTHGVIFSQLVYSTSNSARLFNVLRRS